MGKFLRRFGLLAAFALVALSMVLPASAGTTVYFASGSCSGEGVTHQWPAKTEGRTYGGSSNCLASLEVWWFDPDPVYGGWYNLGYLVGYNYLQNEIGFSTSGKSHHSIKQTGLSGDVKWSYSWI